jgi:hypothetical protein
MNEAEFKKGFLKLNRFENDREIEESGGINNFARCTQQ